MIPINDLSRRLGDISDQLVDLIKEVVLEGNLILGPKVHQLQEELKQFLGAKHVLAVASGTDALVIGLRALGAGPGTRIFATPNSGGYATVAAHLNHASMEYVDCDSDGSMSVQDLEARLSRFEGKSLVVVTHLFGLMSNSPEIREICDRFGALMVEDCAQAFGARYGDYRAGQFGDLSTFSFYPTKNLGALGDAGAIATSDTDIAASVVQLRQYGWQDRYQVLRDFGMNSRMDDIQAVAILDGLQSIERRNEIRRTIWMRYFEALNASKWRIIGTRGSNFVAHLAVIVTPQGLRGPTRDHFESRGISTAIHYPILDYHQPPWATDSNCPCAEDLVERILTIPLFPELTEDEILIVVDALGSLDREVL